MLTQPERQKEMPRFVPVASFTRTRHSRPGANRMDRPNRFNLVGPVLLGAVLAVAAWMSIQAWTPHLLVRGLAALCGAGAAIYLGLAVVQPRVSVGLLNLVICVVIFGLALNALTGPRGVLVAGFTVHALWAGVQWLVNRSDGTSGTGVLPGWAVFCAVLGGLMW